MVIDSSALIAILMNEPERRSFQNTILAAGSRLISAVAKLETSMVAIGRRGSDASTDVDELLRELNIVVVPFDERQADIARAAFARYGKGRHAAALNFGDCATYALAIAEAEPLLFKGADFVRTDVPVA